MGADTRYRETCPDVAHVAVDGRQMVHVMTDGVLIGMTVTQAQLFMTRFSRAVEQATAANIPTRGGGRPMSAKMNRKIHAMLGNREIVGTARHRVLSKILDRPISSANDLDFGDAMFVISVLEDEEQQRTAVAVPEDEPF